MVKILLVLLLVLIVMVLIYLYKCTTYWKGDYKAVMNGGFVEKQVTLADGSVVNYGEGPNNGDALILIHGQTGAWEDYCRVLPQLSQDWHIFAVDCYGHGGSSHDPSKYYLKENGDDLIWFINEVIGEKTVVSGHSSGALLAAYIAAYGGENIIGAVLEDPPVFSTEEDYFEKSFAYQDTYKVMHDYTAGDQAECWEAYYLRHCLWGQLFMASSMDGIANYAQHYHEKNLDKPVQIFFLPESINSIFLYTSQYDFEFGAHFYDYTWHSDIKHETLMGDISVPTVYLHVQEQYTEDGILMAAASNAQGERATQLIKNCQKYELTGQHNIHRFKPKEFIRGINCL